MSKSLNFVDWMLKIQSVYYANDPQMQRAIERIKNQEDADRTPDTSTN